MRNSTENKIKLFLIRHGETSGNLEKRYIGRTDENLCSKGKENILNKVSQKKYEKVEKVFSSPMIRCLETSKLIFGDLPVCIIQDFSEIDFGEFEGYNYKELSDNPDYIKWIESNGTLPFPNGESREDFIFRSVKGFKKVLQSILNNGSEFDLKKYAIIAHGGTIMAILSTFCDGDYFDFQIGNGEGYECFVDYNLESDYIRISELRRI